MRKLLTYFFQGLLYTVPIAATLYVLYASIRWMDSWTNVIPWSFPGMGVLIIIAVITLIGYLGSIFLFRPIKLFVDKLVSKIPLVGLIYSSIKDLISAFVGEKKKFKQPVLVNITADGRMQRLGFITQSDLSALKVTDKVAVYLPHSYNISGNVFIMPKDAITLLNLNGGDVMKFIVSGGVSELS
jgi:uncharacterized membrane protein